MFDKFTDRARKAASLAQTRLAVLARCMLVPSTCYLLSVEEGEGIAAQALAAVCMMRP